MKLNYTHCCRFVGYCVTCLSECLTWQNVVTDNEYKMCYRTRFYCSDCKYYTGIQNKCQLNSCWKAFVYIYASTGVFGVFMSSYMIQYLIDAIDKQLIKYFMARYTIVQEHISVVFTSYSEFYVRWAPNFKHWRLRISSFLPWFYFFAKWHLI